MSLTPREIQLVAVDARLDTRTVARGLAGFPMRTQARERLRAALASRGVDLPQTTALRAEFDSPVTGGKGNQP